MEKTPKLLGLGSVNKLRVVVCINTHMEEKNTNISREGKEKDGDKYQKT